MGRTHVQRWWSHLQQLNCVQAMWPATALFFLADWCHLQMHIDSDKWARLVFSADEATLSSSTVLRPYGLPWRASFTDWYHLQMQNHLEHKQTCLQQLKSVKTEHPSFSLTISELLPITNIWLESWAMCKWKQATPPLLMFNALPLLLCSHLGC